ncbi:alpha/beta fold hydrolase [Plastoroseomonas hellenica]|uniref:alpha/beta fold hydrolase n=1 Tax=Plastoroseomonas hellenica TaxID=2687306 RepID=UPI001BA52684|nr:alpha/beta hydrolase [Plastoroseomonas hellenica]MBR0646830.1 alpha/beta fold hydrolase [Plastoroseomonas hellenica]
MEALALHGVLTGAGPLVVLLHPVGLDHRFWGMLPGVLAAERRVLALDLAGHGQSPQVARPRSIEEYADDVAAAIVQAGGDPAEVVGLSFGGMIAQVLALRHPHLIGKLVPGGCGGTFAAEVRPMLQERGLAAERDGMAAVVPPTLERWFSTGFAGSVLGAVRERLLAQDVAGWSAGWHAIAGLDATPRLGQVRVPTLVIAGERDAATPAAITEATVMRVIPGARLAVLPGAPHMMQLECAEAYTRAVAGFLLGAGADA